jgi:polysaccharide pyruvyl transferase WcaK-like protein
MTKVGTTNRSSRWQIAIFGYFAGFNFGNDSTLQAVIYHIQRRLPTARITCICTNPEAATRLYNIDAVPLDGIRVKPHLFRTTPFGKMLRPLIFGIPGELYRWFEALRVLKGIQILIVSGSGLLTDANGILNFGPYHLFKWALMAKLCRCKLIFLSVGAGPIFSTRGRWLIKAALALSDFRSYRDQATKKCLNAIGVQTGGDNVSPDLTFSLPKTILPPDNPPAGCRPVVGLGLMLYQGEFSASKSNSSSYLKYLGALRLFVKWLLSRGYDVRLLTGDLHDRGAVRDFKKLLNGDAVLYDGKRILEEPITSVEDLLSQLMATEAVVATRFHNTLLALLLNKPTISIAFHQKCVSLMSDMGLSEYCQNFEELNADKLIAQFCELEKNATSLKVLIRTRTVEFRRALNQQYDVIFRM